MKCVKWRCAIDVTSIKGKTIRVRYYEDIQDPLLSSQRAVLKFTVPVIRTRLLRNVYFSLLRSALSRDINLHNLQCGAHAILHLIEARISLPWANTKFHIPSTRLVTRFPWRTLRSREIFLLSDNESSCMLYPSVIYQTGPSYYP